MADFLSHRRSGWCRASREVTSAPARSRPPRGSSWAAPRPGDHTCWESCKGHRVRLEGPSTRPASPPGPRHLHARATSTQRHRSAYRRGPEDLYASVQTEFAGRRNMRKTLRKTDNLLFWRCCHGSRAGAVAACRRPRRLPPPAVSIFALCDLWCLLLPFGYGWLWSPLQRVVARSRD